ncbi:MAG: HEAT repeat domain-containing protein [Planctomycetes bacterium]|nr:HEAT repeat domain-containing protein [Planctomycetota bacterium]
MKSMLFLRVKLLSILLLLLCCGTGFVCGDEVDRGKKLHSQFVAGLFHDIGFEILNRRGASAKQVEQAMVFLVAASELDQKSAKVNETILNASSLVGDDKYDKWIRRAFEGYCGRDADILVAGRAVSHFLEGDDSSDEHQEILSDLLSRVGERNLVLNSDLSTRLGLLLAVKGVRGSAVQAHSLFRKAVRHDPYNTEAFLSLSKTFRYAGRSMPPSMYVRNIRFSMTASPMDIDLALLFAVYAGRAGLHDVACQGYEHWSKLHHYLKGDEAYESSAYVPWAFSSYCTKERYGECLKILNIARDAGYFDVKLESIAAKAAFKMSNKALGEQILANIEDKIKSTEPNSSNVNDMQAAWFYSFVSPDPAKAMTLANRAYTNDPNSIDTKAMLGFTIAQQSASTEDDKPKLERATLLLTENQNKRKGRVTPLYQVNQIAALGRALAELRKGDSKSAAELLQYAVRMSERSFVADKAKELLKDLSAEYKAIDNSGEIIKALKLSFPGGIVPKFVRQEDIISARLVMASTDISFGTEPEVKLLISNKWTEPLVIFDKGPFKGNIRVDAEISGDIKANIHELISKKIRPGSPIKGGGHILVPLKVMTGSLRRILGASPQASVEIKFTVYLDPVVDQKGNVASSVKGVGPIIKKLRRPGVKVNNRYLLRSLNELSKGRFKQKIRSGQLFTGLFSEQYTKNRFGGKYRIVPVQRSVLTGAIRKNIADDDWMIKTAGISHLLDFRPPVDFEITKVVSENLNHSKWPVRMVALHMLSITQGNRFLPVLQWKAKNDPDLNVRRLAESLLKSK